MMRVVVVADVAGKAMLQPYDPGDQDCFFLLLDVIDAVRGTNYRARFAGRYTTLAGAQRALRKEGHSSLVGLLEDLLQAPMPAGLAEIGDGAVCEIDGLEHAAFWNGSGWSSRTADGPRIFTHADVKAAFKV